MASSARSFLLTIAGCFILISAQAQKKGYVSTKDNVYQQGRIIYDRANPEEVTLQITDQESIDFKPDELKSFGFLRFLGLGDSIVYESGLIELNNAQEQVFLRQISRGEHGFLEFEVDHRVFYRFGEQLTELTRENYKTVLESISAGSPFWKYRVNRIRFNKTQLALFFEAINHGSKTQINFPKLQAFASSMNGDLTLKGITDSSSPFVDSPMDFKRYNLGISYYVPFTRKVRLGLNMNLSYEQHNIVASHRNGSVDKDLHVSFDRALFEIAPAYKLAMGRLIPSIYAGLTIGYSLNQESELHESLFANNQVNSFSVLDPVNQPTVQPGYGAGFTLDFLLSPGIVVSAGASVNSTAINAGDFKSLNSSYFTFKIGL